MPSPAPVPRHSVLGVGVHATTYAHATAAILAAARARQPFTATALAVHGVMTGRLDPAHQQRLNALDLVTPDGQPVRWALNWLHRAGLADRVYGPFLMLRLCEGAAAEGLPVFLYGSDDATLAALDANLRRRFPALPIAGRRPSRFRRATVAEWEQDIQAIRDSGAARVFCGLGCPRQETWVHEMGPALRVPLVAVGAAFSFWAEREPMAPAWMQRAGLEWAFRFAHAPRRLAHRYLILSPLFLAGLIRQKLRPVPVTPAAPAAMPPVLRWS